MLPSTLHPATRSCTTPSSSWPHTRPPLTTHPSSLVFSSTRYVGTPHRPSLSAWSVLTRSWSLICCCEALLSRSALLKPEAERCDASVWVLETSMFCSQQARTGLVRVGSAGGKVLRCGY